MARQRAHVPIVLLLIPLMRVLLKHEPSALRGVPTGFPAPEYGLHLTNFFGFIGPRRTSAGLFDFMAYVYSRHQDRRGGERLLRCRL